ncbi:MAG TPA: TPM domain-containing protein, partial [Usitatibacter sp.]|nr:TPM domain-containing protein [Usitatibacter sp.]
TSTQVAVATYPSLPSGSLEEFTIAVAERSRLGERGKDNGAILFVFKGERRARLEVGYGLEGALTDAASHRILETELAPAFARGDYPVGIGTTVAAVLATVKDAYTRGWQPGRFAVMMQQVRVALPKLRAQALPTLVQLDFLARFLAAFFGGVFAAAACFVAREVLRSGYNLSRLAKRVVSHSTGAPPLTRRSFEAMLSDLKFVGGTLQIVVMAAGFAVGAIASVAGVVVLAAGGSFGGAGAMVSW